MNFFEIFQASPIVIISMTLIIYIISYTIYIKTKIPLLTPLVTSVILIGICMNLLNINYETYYKNGGQAIGTLIGPATIVLALPIYRNLPILKANLAIILVSVSIGASISIIGVFIMAKVWGISDNILRSLLTKSVTSAIAADLTANIKGIRSIAILAVQISGVAGAIIGPTVCKLLKIKTPLAKGLAMGTAAHAIGTSKAIEMGETEGAMSGLAIGIAGAMTVVLLPILYKILVTIWNI